MYNKIPISYIKNSRPFLKHLRYPALKLLGMLFFKMVSVRYFITLNGKCLLNSRNEFACIPFIFFFWIRKNFEYKYDKHQESFLKRYSSRCIFWIHNKRFRTRYLILFQMSPATKASQRIVQFWINHVSRENYISSRI